MKVVHICTSLDGGAGLCATRIIRATRALGIDAKAIIISRECKYDWCTRHEEKYPWSTNFFIQKIQVVLNRYGLWPKFEQYERRIKQEYQKCENKNFCFTSPVTRYRNLHLHPWIQDADVIHLQWVGNMLDYETFFRNISKPVVWTIHDENPGLGGFHYTSWMDHSQKSLLKIEEEFVAIKRRAYEQARNLTLVAISAQMKIFFESNKLLSHFPVKVIHNGIDANQFSILDKGECRQYLGIPINSIVFVFVAQNIHEERKGLRELIIAIEQLGLPNVYLLCIGGHENRIPKASFPIRCVGFVQTSNDLSQYCSASDYFVMPSFQEAFAQTPMEAMACGTPVVAFPCSGAHDLINDHNGVVCTDFTVEALTEGIREAMSREYDSAVIREDVVNRFSYGKIAQQYAELYYSLLRF